MAGTDCDPPGGITALVLDRSIRHGAFRALDAANGYSRRQSISLTSAAGNRTSPPAKPPGRPNCTGCSAPNPAFSTRLGNPAGIGPSGRPGELLAAAGAPEGPEDAAHDIRVRGPQDAWRTLSLRIRRVRDSDGGPTRQVGTALDVTETRQLESQLRDARDLFASVLTAATEQAIIAMDAAGRIRVFNTGAERLLGVPAGEAIGSTLDRFLDPAELLARCDALGVSDPVEALVTVARLGQPETRRWTARTASGEIQQLSLTVTAVTSADGTERRNTGNHWPHG